MRIRFCLLVLLLGCTESRSDAKKSVPAAEPDAAPPPTITSKSTPNAAGGMAFAVAENIEQVPYCVLFPSPYMVEDFSERWEHGHKVFVHRVGSASTSKMEVAPACGSRSLKEMFDDDKKNITAEDPKVAFAVAALRPESYTLSWRARGRILYGKVWAAPGDPGCFVRVKFDYGEAERAAFDTIIAKVAATTPDCKSEAFQSR